MSEYEGLITVVQQGDFTETQNLVSALLNQGKSPDDIIREGIVLALDIVGKRFSAGECYIPEMLVAARASQRGLDVLTPLLVKTGFKRRGKKIAYTLTVPDGCTARCTFPGKWATVEVNGTSAVCNAVSTPGERERLILNEPLLSGTHTITVA